MSSASTFEKLDPETGALLNQYKNFSAEEVFEVVKNAQTAAIRWQEFGFKA